MSDELKALIDLQRIDLKVWELEKLKEAFPGRLDEARQRVEELDHALTVQKERVEELQTERRSKERHLASEVDKVKKWEGRLHDIKTNREYQALRREIELARGSNSDTETEILELMSAIEEAQGHIATMETELAEAKTQQTSVEDDTRTKLAELDEKIAQESTDRAGLAAKVSSSLLRKYDMVRKKRAGLAIVGVVDETCQGCHMNIPPQLYHTILAGGSVQQCPTCQRLLHPPLGD